MALSTSPRLVPVASRGNDCASAHPGWIAAFHAGDREILGQCYERFFDVVWRAVGSVLDGADQESVVHEVFLQVLFNPEKRRGFRGGMFAPWLATVARNQAIDFFRRAKRERPHENHFQDPAQNITEPVSDEDLDFARFIHDLRENQMPAAWRPVFDARFIWQMSQREAASRLGMHRTTLVYQESRIRRLLRRALLRRGVGRLRSDAIPVRGAG